MKRLGVLALALLAPACMTTRAATRVERPALDVPPPPPRVVEATPVPEPLPEPVEIPPTPVTPAPTTKPRATPRDTSRETVKPEVKPETPPPPEPTPAQPAPSTAPAPLLRTPATVDTAGAERLIRETLKRARDGLGSVNLTRLSGERKKAYNEANDFIERAEAAMKASNFELAKDLADKAEKFSKELQGR
jgi:outer membrane biosynthesis protein TonB